MGWTGRPLDQVRSDVWNTAKLKGDRKVAVRIMAKPRGVATHGARYALWKKPRDLTSHQKTQLATIAKINEPLHRAYLLKEQLREVFHQTKKEDGLRLSVASLLLRAMPSGVMGG